MHRSSRALGLASILLSVLVTNPANAIPPGETGRGFVEGANHHLGDASFVSRFGRAPREGDGETMRMHEHLAYVRAWLAARPATRPELAQRRTELLGYLDDYIAAGVTPWNLRLPWRNPVFVDEFGNVCAVGYLIQRSAGRAFVERIAERHRYDYLEDITMPEVRTWIENSGFTLEELASIQPGYVAPMVEQWQLWDLGEQRPVDGPWVREIEGIRTNGAWRNGEMEGVWTRSDVAGHTLGAGMLHNGQGTWRSWYTSGETMAEGAFEHSHPQGEWRFYHTSGSVAAEGSFVNGYRDGEWRFYHDDASHTPIAVGRFDHGRIASRWRHFDAHGALVAESWSAPVPAGMSEGFAGNAIRFATTASGFEHEVHQANVEGDHRRLDALRLGGERLYVRANWPPAVFDATGHRLTRENGAWQSADCHWGPGPRRAAAQGRLATLHNLLVASSNDERCGRAVPLAPARVARVEAVLASLATTRVPSPAFVRALALGDRPQEEGETSDNEEGRAEGVAGLTSDRRVEDLTDVLATNMSWYVEWPHVDGRFGRVFVTLPDRQPPGAVEEGFSWWTEVPRAEAP